MTVVQCSGALTETAHGLEGFCRIGSAVGKVITWRKPLTSSLETLLKHSKRRAPLERPGNRKPPICGETPGIRGAEVLDQATQGC